MACLGLDNLINEAVVQRFLRGHEEIPIGVFLRRKPSKTLVKQLGVLDNAVVLGLRRTRVFTTDTVGFTLHVSQDATSDAIVGRALLAPTLLGNTDTGKGYLHPTSEKCHFWRYPA